MTRNSNIFFIKTVTFNNTKITAKMFIDALQNLPILLPKPSNVIKTVTVMIPLTNNAINLFYSV